MIREEEVYRIGKIGRPHGIKGEVSFMFTDDVFDRVDAEYLVIKVDGILVPFYMEEYRFRTDETALVKFEGIDSQEQARGLTNCEVFFPVAMAEVDEENFTWAQLTGFTLTNGSHRKVIGKVESIDDSTEYILMTVVNDQNRQILIPATPAFIKDINVEKREIWMELPEGLLEL